MMTWFTKCYTNPQGIPKEFKMCYKNFRLENGILMYMSPLSDLSPVAVIPRANSWVIINKYHDNVEAGHPGHEETYNSIRH